MATVHSMQPLRRNVAKVLVSASWALASGVAAGVLSSCSDEPTDPPPMLDGEDAAAPSGTASNSASSSTPIRPSTTATVSTQVPTQTASSTAPSVPVPSSGTATGAGGAANPMPSASNSGVGGSGVGGAAPLPGSGGNGGSPSALPDGGVSPDAATANPTDAATQPWQSDASSDSGVNLPPLFDAGDAGDAGDGGDAQSSTSDGAVQTPDAGPVLDAGPTPGQDASVSVACEWGTPDAYHLGIELTLDNLAATALDLTEIEMRYYFSANTATAPTTTVYFSPIDGTDAEIEVVAGSPAAGADRYISLSFADCAGATCSLATNASNPTIQLGLSSASGGLDASDDYSYTPGDADPCEFVVVLSGADVVFGTPPE